MWPDLEGDSCYTCSAQFLTSQNNAKYLSNTRYRDAYDKHYSSAGHDDSIGTTIGCAFAESIDLIACQLENKLEKLAI